MLACQRDLRKKAVKGRAEVYQSFFKTGLGEYGEGDVFLGVSVPDTRAVAMRYIGTKFSDVKKILKSGYHEDRLLGLILLVEAYQAEKDLKAKKAIVDFYLKNRSAINNWDLVDLSVYKILGHHCYENDDDSHLWELFRSKRHWDRRMAIVGTFAYIRQKKVQLTFAMAAKLLDEKLDLMHKATGWMLREAGKRDEAKLRAFLAKYAKKMPRTMLRYAIERFPKPERLKILKESKLAKKLG